MEQTKKDDKNWYVVYTKPRNEKKATSRLLSKGIEAYCPLVKTLRIWSDRKKKVWIPMFTSYVFVRITEKERLKVLQDMGVLNFIYWLGKPAVVRDEEIEAIKNIAEYSEDIKISEERFEKGKILTINDGPFKGLTGEVVDVSSNIIFIYIEQLGCKIQFRYTKRFLENNG